jgi:hypothetical protein
MARIRQWPHAVSRILLGGALLLAGRGGGLASEPAAGQFVEPAAHATDEESLSSRVQSVERPASTRSARDQAANALPLDKLPEAGRLRVEAILADVSLFRRLPAITFQTEREVYRHFLEHPEVAVSIWGAMEISEFQLKRTAAGRFEATDRDGSTGTIEVLLQTDGETVAVCEGVYRGPLIKNGIRARALFHLRTAFGQGADGRDVVTSRLEMFVSFPSTTVETVARIVSPLSNLIVDRNFREIGVFVHLMSTAMERQPGWVEHLAGRLENLPQARRDELLQLTARVYVEARRRELAETPDAGRRG